MYTPVITSRMNDAVRATRALAAARARHEQGLHLAEGEKLVAEAAAAGASIARLFVEEGYAAPPGAEAEAVYTVSRGVMEALCQSRTPQHVCAAVRTPDTGLPEAFPAGLIVVLDRVQDAGNVGTDLLARHNLGTAMLGNLGAPGTGHVVAPHKYERRTNAMLDGSATHGSGAIPVRLVGTGPIKMHAVLAGIGPNAQIGAAAIPLRQRVDLQHVHALLGATGQIVVPIGLGNARKRAPARIGKPKERFALAQKAVLTTVNGQLSQTHLHVLSFDKGVANRQILSR